MKLSDKIERAFIDAAVAKMEEKGIRHAPFAREIFGEASGARIWIFMRKGERSRALTLTEACRIAERLDMDFPFLVYQLAQTIKESDAMS